MRRVVIVVVAGAAACASKAAAPQAPSTPNAIMWTSCGPTDGPAKTFMVGDAPLTCADESKSHTIARLEIEVWGGAPLADVPLALRGTTGQARRCSAGGACVTLPNAVLTFHADADGTTLGTLSFTEGGVETTRAFRATRCEVHIVCG